MLVKKLSSVATLLLLGLSTQVAAFSLAPGSIEANLNNETIQFEFDKPVSGANNLHVNFGALYTEHQDADSSVVATAGFQGVETDNQTYRAGVGARLYAYDAPGDTNGTAMAVGGLFYHIVPGAPHVSLGGYGWFAPKVTSFGDTKQLYEAGFRVAYRAIQNTDVFLGYRYLHLETEQGFDDTLEDSLHVGFRLNF
ncbi:YfaZ family outer membrane protein [Marinospirillum sp.]|uniref:YfaZ family outer membrane protein n=1 Tax=Marinospirillum sp. TaxID=2183934 RepID=UPI00286FCFE9|nr:YfaZ family outer membrane protein [Marinospirillum sp.]MDR9468062.1 YfaZ family outer membrane protein [Marinospirillum sp.]